jgi:hypothetical protein
MGPLSQHSYDNFARPSNDFAESGTGFANEKYGTIRLRGNDARYYSQPSTPRSPTAMPSQQRHRNDTSANNGTRGDGLNEVDHMLRNLSNELDAMLLPGSRLISQ